MNTKDTTLSIETISLLSSELSINRYFIIPTKTLCVRDTDFLDEKKIVLTQRLGLHQGQIALKLFHGQIDCSLPCLFNIILHRKYSPRFNKFKRKLSKLKSNYKTVRNVLPTMLWIFFKQPVLIHLIILQEINILIVYLNVDYN